MRTGRANRARWRRDLTVVALLGAYLFSLLASALHFAQVGHATCEHGELVHVAAIATHAPDASAEPAHALAVSHADLHHHCPLLPVATAGQALVPTSNGTARAVEARIEPRRSEVPRAPRFPRYLLAPHHSPPLA